MYDYYKVLPLVALSCCAGVVATSWSTWLWGWLHRLHHQCLCGSIIPAFGLQGYVTESQLIVTSLLIDRSWATRGCVGNKKFVISIEPQQGSTGNSNNTSTKWWWWRNNFSRASLLKPFPFRRSSGRREGESVKRALLCVEERAPTHLI
jgi:hypothetical protein